MESCVQICPRTHDEYIKCPYQHSHCLRCGRKLKSDTAKHLGYGKICWQKVQNDKKKYKKLF